MRRNTSNSIL